MSQEMTELFWNERDCGFRLDEATFTSRRDEDVVTSWSMVVTRNVLLSEVMNMMSCVELFDAREEL